MNRTRMFIRLTALTAALCLMLSSCSLFENISPESLLKAPRLTGADGKIQQAFEDAVGAGVKLVNPVGGDYRSSYLRYDVDRDGTEEVLVFYTKADAGSEVHIHFLRQSETGWTSVGDVVGGGSEIYRLGFYNFDNAGDYELAVLWTVSDASRNKNLSIYKLSTQTERPRVYQILTQPVLDYLILDFDRDDVMELMYLAQQTGDSEPRLTASLLKYDAGANSLFTPLCDVALAGEATSPEQILYERDDTVCRVYVDCRRTDGAYMTEILDFRPSLPTEEEPVPDAQAEDKNGEAQTSPAEPAAPAASGNVFVRPTAEDGSPIADLTIRSQALFSRQVTDGKNEEIVRIRIPAARDYRGSVLYDLSTNETVPMTYIAALLYDGKTLVETDGAVFYDPSGRFGFQLDALLGSAFAYYAIADSKLQVYGDEARTDLLFTIDFAKYLSGETQESLSVTAHGSALYTKEDLQNRIIIL